MRYDADHKAQTRERVLKEAAAAIRLEGSERVGVATIMSRAGLTHGGFYAHFKSKDDLIAQAIGYMFKERYAAFLARLDSSDPRAALTAFVESYLSMRHRDAVASGCPIPALAGEVPRLPEPARKMFVNAAERLTQGVAHLLEELGVDDAEARASSALAEMIGTLSLVRMQQDTAKAEAGLASARKSVFRTLQID
jgi:TetR/AcrR family transcriptional repressor of nem operon